MGERHFGVLLTSIADIQRSRVNKVNNPPANMIYTPVALYDFMLSFLSRLSRRQTKCTASGCLRREKKVKKFEDTENDHDDDDLLRVQYTLIKGTF